MREFFDSNFVRYVCAATAEEMQTEYRYNLMLGCRLQDGDRFLPIAMIREVQ